ncbi:hypothetical protein ACOSQ2_030441 [Xanthoceras sorbifolium]
MATMEKMFVQIFERRNRIVEQVRHQTLLFDQHLASKCLLDGIAPPPWLWSPSFPSAPSAPTELNKEDLISELLLPCPPSTIPYSSTYCPLYQKPFVAADKGDLPDGFHTEIRNSKKAFDAGDRLSVSPQLPINDTGGAIDGVEKSDSSSASSPQDQRDARIPDITPEPAQSLASFQRSKSRQRALELRNSAKAVRSQLCVDNKTGLFASGNTGAEIASPRQDHVHELELVEFVHNTNERCEVEEANVDDFLSKGKESRKEELISGPLLPGSQPVASYSCSDLVPYNKPAVISENEELPDGFNTEVPASSKGFVVADEQSDLLQLPVHDAGFDSTGVPELESGATSPQDQRNARVSDINPEPFQSLARVQRSKSRQRALELRDSAKAAKSCLDVENDICAYSSVVNRSGIATPQSGQVHESELVKPAEVYNGSCEVEEAKICEFQSKEKGITNYSGRTTRSRSSCQQPSSLRESSRMGNPTSVGRSSRGGDNVDGFESSGALIEENLSCLRSFGSVGVSSCPQQIRDQVTDAVSASLSLKEGDAVQSNDGRSHGMDNMEQPMTEVSKPSPVRISHPPLEHVDELETIKPVDSYYENCVVEEEKVGNVHSRGKGSNFYSGRITRSRSSEVSSVRIRSSVNEMNHEEQPMTRGSKSSSVRISTPSAKYDELESVKPVGISYGSCVVEEAKVGGLQSRENGSNVYSGRITRSQSFKVTPVRIRSHIDKTDSVDRPMSGGSESSPVRISSPLPEHVNELESVKPVDICSGSCGMEEVNVQSREDGSNFYSGGITRSRSSKSTPVTIRSSIDKMDHAIQPMTGGSKSSPVRISSPLLEHVDELKSVKSLNVDNSSGTGRSSSDEKNIGSSKSGQQIVKKLLWSGKKLSSGEAGSSPQLKRRRIESQLNDSLSASPNLRAEAVAQPNVIRSPVAANDPNGGCQIIDGSQSSPKLLVDKGELSLEERDRSACTPFTFSHKESEMPLIRSLITQATGDSNVCSDVEAEEADPANFILDSLGQGTKRENEVLLHLDDKFEQGNTEHFTRTDTGLQEGTSRLEAEEADPAGFILDSWGQGTERESEVLLHFDDKFEQGNTEHLTRTDTGLQEGTSRAEENGKISYRSLGSPRTESMELTCADQVMPEFEGFLMQTDSDQSQIAGEDISFKLNLPITSTERASLLEQLCKSACMHTPLSHFSTTYKLHGAPNLYQSVPNGLLECIDMKSNLEVNDDIGKQLKASYNYFKEEVNQALPERSHSDCLPLSNAQSAWDIKKPFTSPVGKLWDRITSIPGSSEKRGSLNPELPCISEENEYTEEVVDVFQEALTEEIMPTSVKREPLADITENPNLPASASEAEIFAARNSLESVNTEYSFIETCNGVNQKIGHHNSSKKGQTNKAKVSNSLSIGECGINKVRESVQGRFSKQKLSGKPSLRKEGPSLGGREAKRNNIVSNVSSFVPLVQRKPAPAIITGKRDVKVKALEAAEAAKRVAQEKENERKMKKEALKVERARMELENLKQMQLQKKMKEEERKKKEADMAARKRQREEEEKKDKERKRKRVMETWKQQRENEEKLRTKKEKELKCQPVDERAKDMKTSRNEAGKDDKKEKEMGNENLGKLSKTEPKTTMLSTNSKKASIFLEACEASTDCGDNSKLTSDLVKATVGNIFTNTNQEESYDISPYKESDDEDEDDDDMPNSKFIPSWASKKCLARAVSSQQRLNPEVIFTPESFCSIAEVLLPRRLQPK